MIVSVCGGKGGVGKSTVSLNLARELDAVVVDADLATADLPRGDGGGPTLHDVLAGRADPMAAVERVGRVRVLPCGRSLEGARASTLSAFEPTVRAVERRCGRVVVDCPAGIARDVGAGLASADVTVLVTVPTRAALSDGYRTRRLALEVETPLAAIVLNRVRRANGERLAERVEAEWNAPTTVLEERAAVAAAQAAGDPVRDAHSDDPAVEAFESVALAVERCERRVSGSIGVL